MLNFKKKKINVLFECNSCRDYAFAKVISQSKILNKLYLFGENKNASKYGEFVSLEKNDYVDFIKTASIDLFISFSEKNSLLGLIDFFKYQLKIPTIGMTKRWFYLEAFKNKAKKFMQKNEIKTPEYYDVNNREDLKVAIDKFGFPLVLKVNTLSSGFGVYIVNDYNEAMEVADNVAARLEYEDKQFFNSEFDEQLHIVAEEYVNGIEYSIVSLYDGKKLLTFLPIVDYKRLYDGNLGQNTGGLGGYMPADLTQKHKKMVLKYVQQLEKSLKKSKAKFTGFITSGILFRDDKLYVLEFNMRPGDTEGQILFSHIKNDLLELLYKAANGKLNNTKINYKNNKTALVVLVNANYMNKKYLLPNETENAVASKIELQNLRENAEVFLDNTIYYDEEHKIAYSQEAERLLNICVNSKNSFNDLYEQISSIKCENVYYRKDIGK